VFEERDDELLSYLLHGRSQDVKNEEAVQGSEEQSPSGVQEQSPGGRSGSELPSLLSPRS